LPEPHLWFARPIGEDDENFVTRTYTYGTTMNGSLPPHHGVEFYNPQGTPILAAGDGIVVFAGPDVGWAAISPQPNFYGNAVVIQHTQAINGQPVYTLYGHMSFVAVALGQIVHTGDVIGKVGGTGVALGGTHLHFEVRVGYNDYVSTRNPEMWLIPFSKWGTLVGRVVDRNGQLIPLVAVAVRSGVIEADEPVNRYLTTYANETINPDPAYGENFAIMDLPPGTYTVQVGGTKILTQTVVIKPDAVTFVEFRDVNPPPTWTATPTETATEKP
jgi:murein DD-endopeptidase MepM/ murein hydrolase activator NlpD